MNAKTQERIDRLLATACHPDVPDADFRLVAETILKEQDRDTRHACADAMNLDLIQNNYHMPASEVLTRAQQACMNVQAI